MMMGQTYPQFLRENSDGLNHAWKYAISDLTWDEILSGYAKLSHLEQYAEWAPKPFAFAFLCRSEKKERIKFVDKEKKPSKNNELEALRGKYGK